MVALSAYHGDNRIADLQVSVLRLVYLAVLASLWFAMCSQFFKTLPKNPPAHIHTRDITFSTRRGS